MKRTQLYLNEGLWKALQIRARQEGTTISELVRRAVREKLRSSPASRKEAMQGLIRIWKNRKDLSDATAYVRRVRKGNRLGRIAP